MEAEIRTLPAFPDLRSFLGWAETAGQVLRLPETVSLRHEMTAVQLAALKVGGPILRFDAALDAAGNRSPIPVIGNLFGTAERVAAGLGMDLSQVPAFGEFLAALRSRAAGTRSDASVLDMAAQAGSLLLADETSGPLLPFAAARVVMMGRLDTACHVLARQSGPQKLDLTVLGSAGEVLAEVEGFLARPVAPSDNLIIAVPGWQQDTTMPAGAPEVGAVLIFHNGKAPEIVAGLKAQHAGATERLIGEDIASLGMPRSRGGALEGLARTVAGDPTIFTPRGDLDRKSVV